MVKNYAHRGFSGRYPENTLLAFEKAMEIGVDGIELDVQLTKDGEVVIIHDEKIDRTTDSKGNVIDYTYEELQKFDASYIYKGKVGFNKIPTLREYFNLIKESDIVTNIELKTGIFEYLGIEKKVLDIIKEYHMEKRVIISSFNHYSVLRMKEISPEIECGFLSETWIINQGEYTKKYGVECYHPHFAMLNEEVVKELKKYGIKINTWTVNEEKDIKDLINKKVDTIITNYPDLVKEIVKKL